MRSRTNGRRRAGPRRATGRLATLLAAAVVLAACAGPAEPGGPADPQAADGDLAPACDELERLRAEPAPDAEPTDPGVDPGSLAQQIEQWGLGEAPDSFAGVWIDGQTGGFAVGFVQQVDDHAAEVRDRFEPGLAVAQASNAYVDLRDVQQRIVDEEMGAGGQEPGSVTSTGIQVMINRVTVGLLAPDDSRLAELSKRYGAGAICFEIQPAPEPLPAHVYVLAKVEGWRGGLADDAFALLEVADDRATAERAWQENVPDDLDEVTDELPAAFGVYGDLDQVDFERQAVVVWSSGESGSCPGWLADVDTVDGVVHLVRDADGAVCTDDYNPYRMVLAVDRVRLPDLEDLPHDRVEDVPNGEVRPYPDGS